MQLIVLLSHCGMHFVKCGPKNYQIMKTKTLVALTAISFFLASCVSLKPFTQQVRDQYKLEDSEIKSIQVYPSYDIILTRGESSTEQKETQQGKLTIATGKSVDQVLIPKGTPGVVERVLEGNRLEVSFEEGQNKTLIFGNNGNGNYTLLAEEWKNNRGKVTYDGKVYFTQQNAGGIYLTFKMKKLQEFNQTQHVAKGKKIK